MAATTLNQALTETDRQAIHERLIPKLTPYVRQVPTAKQSAFLIVNEREAFYGGSAGPGKSSGLLMGALQYVDVPGYAALILRRTFKQLAMPGSLMNRSHEWLASTDARWSAGASTIGNRLVPSRSWVFPSGATLTFGHLGTDRESRRQYESAEFNYVAIDELTAFEEDEYRFLFSRLRRLEGFPVPTRMRSASNPGGRGHVWVKERFVDTATRLKRAVFIPATLDDNPHLDRADYVASLQELHPTLWRRLLAGDWEVGNAGELFQPRVWYGSTEGRTMMLDALLPRSQVAATVRYWDLAAAEPTESNPDPDWTVGARVSRLKRKGFYCIEHIARVRTTPGRTEAFVRQTAEEDGPRVTQWVEQTPGAGKALAEHYKRDVFPSRSIVKLDTSWSGKAKGVRARPLAAAMERLRVFVVRADWNGPLFDEQEAFSEDPQHSGAHDDQVDGCSGAFTKAERTIRSQGGSMELRPMGSVRR